MSKSSSEVKREAHKLALSLPPVQRLQLIEDLLQSLSQTTPELDQLWDREAQNRLQAFRKGEITSRPADLVLAKYRASNNND